MNHDYAGERSVRKRLRRGGSLVEFALGFPLVVILFVGLTQLALAFQAYYQLASAVQRGARYAATAEFSERHGGFEERVKNLVVYGAAYPDGDVRPVLPGLGTDHVAVVYERDAAGAPRSVTVSITQFALPALLREIRLAGRPALTLPYRGAWQVVERSPRRGLPAAVAAEAGN